MRKFNFLMVLIFGLVAGCDDPDLIDITAPTIEVKVPEQSSNIVVGLYLPFEAAFIDDFELATYNIEIHDNFGGHSHGRLAATNNDPSLIKWAFKQSFLIPDGLTLFQTVFEDEVLIPSNTLAGPYHFIVKAIDKAGNATSFQDDSAVELEVYLTNDSQPIITITNLVNDELEIKVDVVFMVKGDVTDPTMVEYSGMHSMSVVLGEGNVEHDHDHGGRVADGDLIDAFFEEQELQQLMVDDAIILDSVFEYINFSLSQTQLDELISEEVDHLLLQIKVYDEQGNISISNTDVHVHMD
jgi:hypothetical protein